MSGKTQNAEPTEESPAAPAVVVDSDLEICIARGSLIQAMPYLATAVYNLYPVKVDKIRRMVKVPNGYAIQEMDTFGVSQKGILFYTEAAVAKYRGPKMTFILAHEVMHVILKHLDRTLLYGYDKIRSNLAQDLFINGSLEEAQLGEPPASGYYPRRFGWPNGLTSDEYYDLLTTLSAEQEKTKEERKAKGLSPFDPPKNQKKEDKKKKGKKKKEEESDQDSNDCESSSSGEGSGDPHENYLINGKPDVTEIQDELKEDPFGHCGSAAGAELENEGDLSDSDKVGERSEAEMENIRKQTAEAMKDYHGKNPGKVPGGLLRAADIQLTPPQVRWQEQIKRAGIRERNVIIGQKDYSFRRMNRRQSTMQQMFKKAPVLPSMINYSPTVLVVFDTSGSMYDKIFSAGFSEVEGIIKTISGNVLFASCDAEMYETKAAKNWRDAVKNLKGGGGTDFRPIFEQVLNWKNKPDLMVIFTDGYGPAPETPPPGIKTIWLLTGSNSTKPCNWGTHITIDIKL